MDNNTIILISASFLLALTIFAIVFSIINPKFMKCAKHSADEQRLEKEAEITTLRVTVVDLTCTVNVVGHKMPKSVKEFVISFLDEEEKTHNVHVPEEYYSAFEKGQVGILTLTDNEFYSFEIDD